MDDLGPQGTSRHMPQRPGTTIPGARLISLSPKETILFLCLVARHRVTRGRTSREVARGTNKGAAIASRVAEEGRNKILRVRVPN